MALAPTDIKVAGHWKSVDQASIKIGGHWKPVDQIMEKIAGHWKHIGMTIHPPLFTGAIGDLQAVVGEAFTKDVSHLFSTGPVPSSYSLNNAPAGMVISNAGVISWPSPAAIVAVKHKYWRLFITKTKDSRYTAVAELEMRATIGGATQTTGGTASSSYGASDSAFDGMTSLWESNHPQPQWIAYKFAAPVFVAEITIRSRQGMVPERTPTEFMVEYSDNGTDWNDASGVITVASDWLINETRAFSVINRQTTVTATNSGGFVVSDAFGVSAIAIVGAIPA